MPTEELQNERKQFKQRVEEIYGSGLNPIKHLRQIDYPRRAGTEGDKKAADYIFSTLQEYGYEPKTQEFYFWKSERRPSLKFPLLFLCWGLLSLINIVFLDNNIIISIIVLSAPITVIIVFLNFKSVMKYFFRRRTKQLQKLESKRNNQTLTKKEQERVLMSQNIIAEIGSNESEHHILFTAHMDSISSKFSIKLMKISGIVGLSGFALYSGVYGMNMISDYFFNWNFIELYFPIFLTLLIFVLIFMELLFVSRSFRGNESHGIIDDGTGVAILLETAKFLSQQNIHNYKFIFGFFSAEEAGLIGSSYYFRSTEFEKEKLHVISIDMIGEKPPLTYIKEINPIRKIPMNPTFNSQITVIAEKLEIDIKGSNFLYPGSDFAHWLFDGYKTNWLINSSKFIHTKYDNLDNLHEEMVLNALKLLIGYLLILKRFS